MELGQLALPGRHPGIADVLVQGGGAWLCSSLAVLVRDEAIGSTRVFPGPAGWPPHPPRRTVCSIPRVSGRGSLMRTTAAMLCEDEFAPTRLAGVAAAEDARGAAVAVAPPETIFERRSGW